MLVADVTTQCKQPWPHGSHPGPPFSSGKVHAPVLSTGREIDARWRKWGIGDSFLPGFVAFALDPIAMALEKMLDCTGRGSRRHNHFDAPGVEHTHGQAAGARTFSNDPSLGGGILVRPQRQLWRHHVRHFPVHHGAIIAVTGGLRRQKLNAVRLIR